MTFSCLSWNLGFKKPRPILHLLKQDWAYPMFMMWIIQLLSYFQLKAFTKSNFGTFGLYKIYISFFLFRKIDICYNGTPNNRKIETTWTILRWLLKQPWLFYYYLGPLQDSSACSIHLVIKYQPVWVGVWDRTGE